MILELKIKNFRSIKDEVNISFVPSKRYREKKGLNNYILKTGKEQAVPSLVLYGRNASGKSNILMAFHALEFLVRESDSFKHEKRIPPFEPFLFDKNYKDKPVEFEIVFIAQNDIKYKYVLKFNSKRIQYEALFFYPKGIQAKLYERINAKKISYGEYYEGEKKRIEREILENQLFLSKSASSNIKYLKEAYLFFAENLKYFNLAQDIGTEVLKVNRLLSKINSDKRTQKNLKKLLIAADTNITDFKIREIDAKSLSLPNDIPEAVKKELKETFKYDINTKHLLFEGNKKIGETEFDFNEESLGTKRMMAAGGLILPALYEGGLAVIDELDKSLHPFLTKLLINLFHLKNNNPNNAQLIITTHDSSLLDSDLFRRDQICFVEKEYEGDTKTYRLSDIKGVRKDAPYDKWYLSGRFKAVPIIDDVELDFSEGD